VVRLGQNFLRDPNLLDAIVRDAGLGPDECVLEVGVGEGPLTKRLAETAGTVHAIELDRSLEPGLAAIAALGNVDLIFGDALEVDLAGLEPPPTAMVSNLPYSVAVPVIIRTVIELPALRRWTVMVQREIADRLAADPGGREYGTPSAIVQRSATVRMVRKVGREVFSPRPRVDSAVISIERTGPPPDPDYVALVRAGFAHRRKALARSVDTARPGTLDLVREALDAEGIDQSVRAEALGPDEFGHLAARIGPLPE
jgi:16S rRNA (adenine1518-N6/adenine1519-N6)-dimethyltransferase